MAEKKTISTLCPLREQSPSFRGSLVALATPFLPSGRIDWRTVEKLVAWHLSQGTDGLVCCGATGEGMTISDVEKLKMVAVCANAAGGKMAIIGNSGSADTMHSARLSERMLKAGASGTLVVVPYYNKPTQKGCFLHFSEIAKAGLPVIIYNNPGRVNVRLEAETVAEISSLPHIAGYKDSTGDIELLRKIRAVCNIAILAGDDDRTFHILSEGGCGAISVIGNLFPKEWKQMISLAMQGDFERAQKISLRYRSICQTLFLEPNPQCLKFAMGWLGKCQKILRLPLHLPQEVHQAKIKQALLGVMAPLLAS